ncbi:MAG: glycosyltransferase family A protein [Actinomycetota bacterium]
MAPAPQPELTVILTAHNRADLVEETLSSLADQAWDGEWNIVLVDNDSTDDTPAILERWVDKMTVPTEIVTATELHNLSYARHAGVAVSNATSIAFLDDDDVIAPGYVAAIGEALRLHELVGPRHEHALLNDPMLAKFRGSFQTTGLGNIFGATMVSGGGFACRRDLWNRLDGHCIETGYGAEDAEFALRASLAGVTPSFVPDAVYHVRLRGGDRASFRQGRVFAMSRVRLYRTFGAAFDHSADSPARIMRNWAGMMLRMRNLHHEGPRLVWMWQLGQRIGYLQGSLRYRVWYP